MEALVQLVATGTSSPDTHTNSENAEITHVLPVTMKHNRPVNTDRSNNLVQQAHVYHPDKATNGSGVPRVYACGYCGYRKMSSSSAKDMQVRIRCSCGGMKRDGTLR